MKRDAKTVAGWKFEKIIPCHGVSLEAIASWHQSMSLTLFQDVIEKDGNKAWREAYKAFLD